MDLFTHVVLGATVGGLLGAKKIGNKAILWGAVCGLIPNFDLLILPFIDSINGLFVHRGFSHSLLFCILISPLLALGLRRINSKLDFSLANWTNFVFFVLISHCILDVFTVYGTGLLEPFYSKRFAISSIAVVDLFFTIPLIFTIILAFRVKKNHHKSIISWLGIFISVLYISFTFLNKLYIQSEFEKKLVQNDIRFSRTEIFPVTGSNFLWNCVAQDRDGFWMCYESNFSKHNFELELFMRNDYYIFDFEEDKRIQDIKRFTRDYYIVQKLDNGDVLMHDLRFGRMGLNSQAPFIFSFKIRNTQGTINFIEKIQLSFLSLFSSKNK